MKKILITQRLTFERKTGEVRDALDVRWGELFETLGYLPLVSPTRFDVVSYFTQLKIDGVIFSGGNDLHSLTSNSLSEERDRFENKLIRHCLKSNIPIMGVCRGMQLIAGYFKSDFKKLHSHVGKDHAILPSKGSAYYSYLKRLKTVNSYHSWGVSDVPSELVISAKSEDGFIEAFEHKKYRIWGQMWHPERDKPFKTSQIALMKTFFA